MICYNVDICFSLFLYWFRYDAVTYLKYLDSLRASESFRSVWVFVESSYKIFEYAKKRVYHFGRLNGETLTTPTKSVKSRKRKLEEVSTSMMILLIWNDDHVFSV